MIWGPSWALPRTRDRASLGLMVRTARGTITLEGLLARGHLQKICHFTLPKSYRIFICFIRSLSKYYRDAQ